MWVSFYSYQAPEKAAAQRVEGLNQVRDTIDNSIFAIDLALSALANSELKSHSDQTMKSMNILKENYDKASKYRFVNDHSIHHNKTWNRLL